MRWVLFLLLLLIVRARALPEDSRTNIEENVAEDKKQHAEENFRADSDTQRTQDGISTENTEDAIKETLKYYRDIQEKRRVSEEKGEEEEDEEEGKEEDDDEEEEEEDKEEDDEEEEEEEVSDEINENGGRENQTPEEFCAEFNDTYIVLNKCCSKGEYLTGTICVAKPDTDIEDIYGEHLHSLVNSTSKYWVPELLQAQNICTIYNILQRVMEEQYDNTLTAVLEATSESTQKFLNIDNEARRFELGVFDKHVDQLLVDRQEFCFDATDNVSRPLVIITSVYVHAIYKCCDEEAFWDSLKYECNYDNEIFQETAVREALSSDGTFNSTYWIPQRLSDSMVYVKYYPRVFYDWTVSVDPDDETLWKLVWDTKNLNVLLRDAHGIMGSTSNFCFDVHHQNGTRVLLASIIEFKKCCSKGAELNAAMTKCIPKTGFNVEEIRGEFIYNPQNTTSAYWIPKHFYKRRIAVKYGHAIDGTHAFPAETTRSWNSNLTDLSKVELRFTMQTPSGHEETVTTENFCFDSVSYGPMAPIALLTQGEDRHIFEFTKCCPRSQILTSQGFCTEHDEQDWSPLNSSFASFLDPAGLYATKLFYHWYCKWPSFYVEEAPTTEAFYSRLVNKEHADRFFTKFYCVDYIRGADSLLRETLAFCAMPHNGPTYEAVRPLHVLAAALLAAALVVAACNDVTRRSTHGRALACHAACLLGANALQAAWFFTYQKDENCTYYSHYSYYAHAIYFFLISGNVWLNVISLNMVRGFRLLQNAGQRQNSWKLFMLFSFYAWGISGALTAFAIYMHRMDTMYMFWIRALHYTPSFMETRTCFIEWFFYSKNTAYRNPKMGTLLYFYVPVSILVVMNAVCLAITIWRIRYLRKGSSALNTPATLQNILLYVKLLLTAGVIELAVEASSWVVKQTDPQSTYSPQKFTLVALVSSYRFAVIMTFVDVGRAAMVLWLCVGRWSHVARWGWRCLQTLWRRLQALRPLAHQRPDDSTSKDAPGVASYTEDTSL